MCVLGKRLLKDINVNDCHKKQFGPLYQIFCGNSSTDGISCDPYFEENNVSKVRGIKGLSSGVFLGKFYTCEDSLLVMGNTVELSKIKCPFSWQTC
jgi:potassium/chloride transporter 4/5/6